jgi:hypothetical protein
MEDHLCQHGVDDPISSDHFLADTQTLTAVNIHAGGDR